jgi:glycosyltransferase involved in cell wall biosynthesis
VATIPRDVTVDLSVVVPVYNNAETLDELIDRMIAVLDPMAIPFELIFVDDGSRDGGLRLLESRADRDPRIRPFALVRNFGSQSAACAGFDLVRGRWVVMLDADLENCPEDIPALLAPLRAGYDLVCGYREHRDAPWLTRRLPSQLMNAYVRRQTGTHIRDVGCGMRACEAWVVKGLEAEGEARRLLTPLFLRRARRVTEVALRPVPRRTPPGHSFFTLLAIALDYYMLTARRPFLVSGTLSLLGIIGGAGMLVLGPRLAGLVVAASGLLGGLLSLVGEYCQRLYQLGQGVPFYELRDRDAERARAEAAEREAALRAARR